MTLLTAGALMAVNMAFLAEGEKKPEAGIEIGKPAPAFTLKDQDGKEVKLSSFKGKKSILIAFYPKDFTGG